MELPPRAASVQTEQTVPIAGLKKSLWNKSPVYVVDIAILWNTAGETAAKINIRQRITDINVYCKNKT